MKKSEFIKQIKMYNWAKVFVYSMCTSASFAILYLLNKITLDYYAISICLVFAMVVSLFCAAISACSIIWLKW